MGETPFWRDQEAEATGAARTDDELVRDLMPRPDAEASELHESAESTAAAVADDSETDVLA